MRKDGLSRCWANCPSKLDRGRQGARKRNTFNIFGINQFLTFNKNVQAKNWIDIPHKFLKSGFCRSMKKCVKFANCFDFKIGIEKIVLIFCKFLFYSNEKFYTCCDGEIIFCKNFVD